ncbi:MAG: hypothetical protein CMM47_01580 [Rhodospirillaceae bacterium]|nr:hypothetical protein [Rhodospirillaceae bacterium]
MSENTKNKRRETRERIRETIFQLAKDSLFGGTDDGICMTCGNVQSGVEPDARGYTCESCGESAVQGAEWAILSL